LRKPRLKFIFIATLVYILATVVLILASNANILNNDTTRVLNSVDRAKTFMTAHPDIKLTDKYSLLPASTKNSDTEKISAGAEYSRTIQGTSIQITSPIYQNGQIKSYIKVIDTVTPVWFTNLMILLFSTLVYICALVFIFIRARQLYIFTENTVAKIKNIERSSMSQSYLINENDDKLTKALNHLGETIQAQVSSNTEKKENLYEFIEFFQFPIFIYSEKGTIHRTNALFKDTFSDTHNLDIFSPYADFLSFLVDMMIHPTLQEKNFYFQPLNAYYYVRILPLADIDNRFLVSMHNITQYRQTLDAHNDFIANVSHELKTPLTSIKGFAEILEKGDIAKEQAQEFSSIINKESSRLMSLVQDTLTLTKQNNRIKKKSINISRMIGEILRTLDPQITQKNLAVTQQLDDISLKTDKVMIHSIFKNLIENAIKYTADSGKVFVQLHKEQGKIIFSVADNGPGLTEIQKSRIFERFYRTDEGRMADGGTGLGLAIVEKNVRDLGGEIDLVSILDKGTTFTVRF